MSSRLFLSSYCMCVVESVFTDDLIDLLLHDPSFVLSYVNLSCESLNYCYYSYMIVDVYIFSCCYLYNCIRRVSGVKLFVPSFSK